MSNLIARLKQSLRPYRWLHYMLSRGHWLPEEMWTGHFSFSQFGEDIVLKSLFNGRDCGYYVDIGAFDPIKLSNTHIFHRAGWRGINIEPNPAGYERFLKLRPDDHNLQVAVSSKEGRSKLRIAGEMTSLLDDQEENSDDSVIEVETLPLSRILDKYLPKDSKLSFISIDCEGHDLEVLRSNDWSNPHFAPSVLVVEALRSNLPGIVSFMSGLDYFLYCKIGLSVFFLKRDEFSQYNPELFCSATGTGQTQNL